MPAEPLTPYAGFFGKLPATGDFVARGLPEGFVARWDGWVTRHVASLDLPADGLRFSLASGGRCLAGVILPSADRHGRRFPLTLAQVLPGRPAAAEVDRWCDAALRLSDLAPDALAEALDTLPPSEAGSPADGPLRVWTKGAAPVDGPLDAPDGALRAALSSRGCSTP